jgi:WD40 repeat protein
VAREQGVTLWDVESRKASRNWHIPGGNSNADARATLNPAGTLLAAASAEGPVRLWNVAAEREIARLDGHASNSIDVAFHPDGSLLATTGMDGTVRLWDVAIRTPVAVLRGHTDICTPARSSRSCRRRRSGTSIPETFRPRSGTAGSTGGTSRNWCSR